jgi:rod shape-determining protein MreB
MGVPFLKSKTGADIYIDLGTANTLVVAEGKGLIINEPSVVAYKEYNGKKKILAVGSEAKEKMGRAPGNMIVTHPLVDGVIADLDVTETMLKYFLEKPGIIKFYRRPEVVISLPYGVTDVEKKACVQAGISAGAKKVYLIDEPMAAAVGAGLRVDLPKASMIIDIGGGTTEVAVISLFGIVHCEAVRVGGHAFDRDIVDFIKKKHNLIIGDQTAENIKIQAGTALNDAPATTATIKGIDVTTGLPKSIQIPS